MARLPSSPEGKVGQGRRAEGVDDYHRRGPYPLGAPDLAGRPALDVNERGRLETGFGHCRRNDEPAAALTEIAPLPGSHGILRVHKRAPDGLHFTMRSGASLTVRCGVSSNWCGQLPPREAPGP